ncbi:MAG: 4-hydroxy-tetrahydrodipicolinate reductase [Clostridia bacterium]|nr:4-hydroxy-tetrahydrodipicolinate reductase [Clostridia bacterium]
MLEVMVNGCNGKMGQIVCDLVEQNENLILKSGFDKQVTGEFVFPVFNKIEDITEKPDVIIDFSVPIATLNILEYAAKNKVPIVIATTGFSEDEEKIILEYSKQIPIFKSANMSYDIMIMKKILQLLAPLLKDTDIEITETHHNRKIDSPSGTAQMLANSINESLGNILHCEYNRNNKREKRDKNEIGMTSIRGGNIVGEHTVQFFGEFETFEIKHTSYSRNVFADGAIKAAEFIIKQENGLYNMEDMFDTK